MKFIKYLSITLLILNFNIAYSQSDSSVNIKTRYQLDTLTTEPCIGINPYPTSDFIVSNVLQWNLKRRLCIIAYTTYSANNAFERTFNYITNDYNYTLSQKFGIGTTFYAKKSSHTISFLSGIKYDAYKETLDNPDFEKVSVSFSSVSPDFGLMYNLKFGRKKYFFSYRMYIPLYPYPFLTSDILATDANVANISMEFGVGIRLK
jgi:hypothetical protein